MHIMKPLIEVCEFPLMSYVLIDLDFSIKIIWPSRSDRIQIRQKKLCTFDETRNLCSTFHTTKSSPSPSSASHLEFVRSALIDGICTPTSWKLRDMHVNNQ